MVKKNFLIAEAGINHNGNIKTALRLVDTAKKSGADAIKFQTYITEKRIKKALGDKDYNKLNKGLSTSTKKATLTNQFIFNN